MASFFEKLKKGMDINKNIENEEENAEEDTEEESDSEEIKEESFSVPEGKNIKNKEVISPIEEITATPLGPQEINPENLGQRLRGNSEDTYIENAAVKTSSAFIKEAKNKKTKKKMFKKAKEGGTTLKVKDSTDSFDRDRRPMESEQKKWFETEGQLVVDVYETENEIVIQSAIAGVQPDELDISIENDVVVIKGKREKTIEKHERNYFYSECHWGYFSREIILPKEVDAGFAQASMKNGILTIRIPKIEKEKKKISVK